MENKTLETSENVKKLREIFSTFKPVLTPVGNNWFELSLPKIPQYTFTKSYQKRLAIGFLAVLIEHRQNKDDVSVFPHGRLHLSMSHNVFTETHHVPGRIPTWDELKEVRYKFLPAEKNFAIMFPPKELYYNLHETCLHLLEIPVNLALDPKITGGI